MRHTSATYRKNRKGQQSGGKAASLIALILGMIILYILFLPPEERKELLRGNDSDDDQSTSYGKILRNEHVLLREFIGDLDYFNRRVCDYDNANRYCEHTVPNINLYDTRDAVELSRLNAIYVKSGWFEKETKTLEFTIKDLSKTQNVHLTFGADKRQGRLIILLNNKVIYENEIKGSAPPAIILDDALLQSKNTLTFMASSVGGSFWTTNEYLLTDIKVLAEVVSNEKQTGEYSFSMRPEEADNLERAFLEFFPICDPRKVGVLNGYVNGMRVFSAIPECEVLNKQEIRTNLLRSGSNDLTFSTEQGKYLIEKIKVKTDIKQVKKATFYFELNQSDIDDIRDGDKQVNITFFFVHDDDIVDDIEFKLNVNGHLFQVDNRLATRGSSSSGERIRKGFYSKVINTWVEEGNNFIQIEPQSRLNIKELRVSLYDIDDD